MEKPTNDIKDFWNENPVGSNFISYQQDKSFYEKYDEFRYRTEGHILGELDKIDFKGKKVLEIGLGQGADSMQIIDRGALYYGIDITEESVRRVKERFALFQRPYQEVQVSKAETIPYPENNFDIVYSHGVIHHSPNIEKIVEEIHRVLKPGGMAVIMLYHKQSYNYYVSIGFLRRLGLLTLMPFPFLSHLVSKLTGEQVERINKHRSNIKEQGLSYLKMKNFTHRSTDGPDNVYATVWSDKSSRGLFRNFKNIRTNVHFLNERHLLGLQYIIPSSLKKSLANRYGWHLWIKAIK
ncbi:MAG: class I SAM-dependent methyltransferase [Chitinophagaceae bacterium]|nr:MAG: class I SAM-dependent methyltransferase [Chitinophagaceae bacterium]